MSDDVSEILSKLRPEDVTLDKFGRLTISNNDLADALKATGPRATLAAAEDNYGCCKNGVACDQKSLMEMI